MKENQFASAFVTTLFVIAVVVVFFIAGCTEQEPATGETDGQGSVMTLDEATAIAENSECVEQGALAGNEAYNEYTDTWWIDLEMKPEFAKDYCNPACVISEYTKTAEINWRCTGALPPEE